MGIVKLIKSIYTGNSVTALGEVAETDTISCVNYTGSAASFTGYGGGATNSENGQIAIGNSIQGLRISAVPSQTGYAYIDNMYDGASESQIRFRVRAAGTPIEALIISGNGAVTIPYAWNNTGGTTAVKVDSNGTLFKDSSSERYKKDIEDMDIERADALLQARPVWHRYKEPNGIPNENWGFYGLIAEELAEIDPRLVTWAPQYKEISEEISREVDGEIVTEQITKTVVDESLALIPDGVLYDRLTVPLLSIARRQKSRIKSLESIVLGLVSRIETLER